MRPRLYAWPQEKKLHQATVTTAVALVEPEPKPKVRKTRRTKMKGKMPKGGMPKSHEHMSPKEHEAAMKKMPQNGSKPKKGR